MSRPQSSTLGIMPQRLSLKYFFFIMTTIFNVAKRGYTDSQLLFCCPKNQFEIGLQAKCHGILKTKVVNFFLRACTKGNFLLINSMRESKQEEKKQNIPYKKYFPLN